MGSAGTTRKEQIWFEEHSDWRESYNPELAVRQAEHIAIFCYDHIRDNETPSSCGMTTAAGKVAARAMVTTVKRNRRKENLD